MLWELLVATWAVQHAQEPQRRPSARTVLDRLKECVDHWGESIVGGEPQVKEKAGKTKHPEGDQPCEGLETVVEPEDELMIYPVPDSPILVNLDAPACKRLISRTLSPQEVTSLIEAIFTSKDEVKMVRDLRGDDAQTFIDVIHEVCTTLSFRGTV